jgi:hypothetical protein
MVEKVGATTDDFTTYLVCGALTIGLLRGRRAVAEDIPGVLPGGSLPPSCSRPQWS